MEDYKIKVQELILKFFSPIAASGNKVMMSTKDVLYMVTGVIPSEPISEHDVYEILAAESFEVILHNNVMCWVMNEL